MRVLVVDDSTRVRTSLSRALSAEGYDVDVVGDGLAALHAVVRREPAVMVLDRLLPGMDGTQVCKRLRARGSRLPILMVTVRSGVADRVMGLDAGADDYLVKPFALEELVARLRALVRRTQPGRSPVRVHAFDDLRMDTGSRTVSRGTRDIDLTPTEFDLLAHFLARPEQVLERQELLAAVWGYPDGTTSNTLDVHVGYLRRKLEEDGEPRLVHTVRGVGFVLRSS